MTVYNYSQKYHLRVGIPCASPQVRIGNVDQGAELGGTYQIAGTVDRLGVVGSYRVALFDRASGRYIRETTSSAHGAYTFTSLQYRASGYFVVAFDTHEPLLNAAIADLVTPEPMS